MDESVRINKFLADAGICSRRAADALIASGKVRINGLAATPGSRIRPQIDCVEVNGRVIQHMVKKRCCLMLHKPVQVVSTAKDPDGRKTVLDFVPNPWKSRRLYPVGRLDYFSEGLIFLTDDGPLAQTLTHPKYGLPKTYLVLVRGAVPSESLDMMRRGMTLSEGEHLAPVEANVIPGSVHRLGNRREEGTLLQLTLYQGLNRQIRRMCRDLGLTILRLIRIGHGPITLGDLPPGSVRELTEQEVQALRDASENVALRSAAHQGGIHA
ncbi:MAG: pseudouridine synthase [Desulfovibrionaceae bacterium]|nr:pseudouridine synthase [Desulfovibrionaceae bacterium]